MDILDDPSGPGVKTVPIFQHLAAYTSERTLTESEDFDSPNEPNPPATACDLFASHFRMFADKVRNALTPNGAGDLRYSSLQARSQNFEAAAIPIAQL